MVPLFSTASLAITPPILDVSNPRVKHGRGFAAVLPDAFSLSSAQVLAKNFYGEMAQETVDEDKVRGILKQVKHQSDPRAFNQVLARLARQDSKPYRNAQDLLRGKLYKNPIKRFFKTASYKETLDFLHFGENRFQASAWEHRRLGMWNAVADFVAVCKQYPVMSAGVIGAVAYLGHRYPFLGGISGVAIIAWGVAASVMHEIKAAFRQDNPEEKAKRYERSGENLAAALITSVGYKGIKNGTINGFEHAGEKVALLKEASWPAKVLKGALSAIKARSKEQHKTNLPESILFVSGLFDNVLLPFNWAADRLLTNEKPKK